MVSRYKENVIFTAAVTDKHAERISVLDHKSVQHSDLLYLLAIAHRTLLGVHHCYRKPMLKTSKTAAIITSQVLNPGQSGFRKRLNMPQLCMAARPPVCDPCHPSGTT